MPNKIRLGFVGANVSSNWSSQSHFPALLASPDVEFTAVCTTRPESAEEARQAFGAKLAFHDFRELASSPEIDAVAVVGAGAISLRADQGCHRGRQARLNRVAIGSDYR